jgi:hypothetical protein
MKAYEERLRTPLTEATALRSGRVRFFTGRSERGLKVVGWNINLQSSFGVSGEEIRERYVNHIPTQRVGRGFEG